MTENLKKKQTIQQRNAKKSVSSVDSGREK
jgi:hypothetical protein